LLLDFDDLIGRESPALRAADVELATERVDVLARYREEGWLLFVHAWRPQIARNELTAGDVEASLARLRDVLRGDVDTAYCPHDAGPPICWCRKPIPGSALEFARRRGVSLRQSIVVGASAADRTMAARIGAEFRASATFAS